MAADIVNLIQPKTPDGGKVRLSPNFVEQTNAGTAEGTIERIINDEGVALIRVGNKAPARRVAFSDLTFLG